MTFQQKGEGVKKYPNLVTNSIDFADKEGGGGQKILKLCGRHIWKPPYSQIFLNFEISLQVSFRGVVPIRHDHHRLVHRQLGRLSHCRDSGETD